MCSYTPKTPFRGHFPSGTIRQPIVHSVQETNISNFQVDFKLQSEEGDTATFIENGEWALMGRYNYSLN